LKAADPSQSLNSLHLHNTDLFEWGPYREAGMLLWPDFWPPSPAPDAFAIAPEALAASVAPGANRSVESGQLLLHKRDAWRALLLTWFVNMQVRRAAAGRGLILVSDAHSALTLRPLCLRARCITACCAHTWERVTRRRGRSVPHWRAGQRLRAWPRPRAASACQALRTPSTC
jgi:hypothetical protein